MDFSIGDRVRFLNDEGEGVIISFPKSGWAMVEDQSGFAYEHPISELVHARPVGDEYRSYSAVEPDLREVLDRNIDKDLVKKADKDFKLRYKNELASSERRRGELMEVDLHIHELVERHEGMTNGEIVQAQIEHFERMLRIAEDNKVYRVVFIHGVGQGVLRAEIRKLLSQYYPHCEFHDAPYAEYGYGATEVRIRPTWKQR